MGKSSGKKGFVIADDGTIIRGNNKGGKKGWLIIMVILISIVTIGLTMYINSSEWDNSVSYYEPDEWCDTVVEECVEEPVSEAEVEEYIPDGYVDLGLPSGTLWKDWNEVGHFYGGDARTAFGNQLPTKKEWEELYNCEFTWGHYDGQYGCWVKGPNNNSIFLPAVCDNDGNISDLEYVGRYVSSDEETSDPATWILYFDERNYFMTCDYAANRRLHSVRLVYRD